MIDCILLIALGVLNAWTLDRSSRLERASRTENKIYTRFTVITAILAYSYILFRL